MSIKIERQPQAKNTLMSRLNSPACKSVQDWANYTQSSGLISGGAFSDNGDGSITVAAGCGLIRATASALSEIKFFEWSEDSSVSLTDEEANYISVDYNSGTPQITSSTSNPANGTTIFNIGLVFREGTEVHFLEAGQRVFNALARIQSRINASTGSIDLTSGGVVAETGERYLTVTASTIYGGLTRFTNSAIDTSASDTFEYYYTTAGGDWQYLSETATQINNTQYDLNGTLTALTNNRYRTDFLYLSNDGDLLVILGTNNSSTLVAAQLIDPPTSQPPHISEFATLIAKVIVQEGVANIIEVDNLQSVQFSSSGTVVHNETSDLQGGAADEYYHLDATEFGYLDGQDQAVKTTSDVTFDDITATSTMTLPADSAAGTRRIRYNTTDNILEVHNGTEWIAMGILKVKEVSETSVTEGNNSVTGAFNKQKILWVDVETTSTDWTMTLYSKDDYSTKPIILVVNRNGDYRFPLNRYYEDEDATNEIHYNFTSASGSETHDINFQIEEVRN